MAGYSISHLFFHSVSVWEALSSFLAGLPIWVWITSHLSLTWLLLEVSLWNAILTLSVWCLTLLCAPQGWSPNLLAWAQSSPSFYFQPQVFRPDNRSCFSFADILFLTSGYYNDGMGEPGRGLRTWLIVRMGCTSSAWANRWLCCEAESGHSSTSKEQRTSPLSSLQACSGGCCLSAPSTRISQFYTPNFNPSDEEWVKFQSHLHSQVRSPFRLHDSNRKVIEWPCPADTGDLPLFEQPLFLHLSWLTTFYILYITSWQLLLIFYLRWLCILTCIVCLLHVRSFYHTFYWTINYVMMLCVLVCAWRRGVSGEWESSPGSFPLKPTRAQEKPRSSHLYVAWLMYCGYCMSTKRSKNECNTIPPLRELMVSKGLKQILKQWEYWVRYYEIIEDVEFIYLGIKGKGSWSGKNSIESTSDWEEELFQKDRLS